MKATRAHKALEKLMGRLREDSLVQSIRRHVNALTVYHGKLQGRYYAGNSRADEDTAEAIDQIELAFIGDREALEAKLAKKTRLFEKAHDQDLEREKQRFKSAMNSLRRNYEKGEGRLQETIGKNRQELACILDRMGNANRAQWLSWDDSYWEEYEPAEEMPKCPLTRFGELEIKEGHTPVKAPALVSILGCRNVLVSARGQLKDVALELLRVLVFRLLLNVPPGKLKFIFIDPIGLGSCMAGFMHLPESITGKKIWTESAQIERQLTDLTGHMETIIQKYLRNDYESMEQYNHVAGEIAEPYRVLVIANLPANFTQAAAQRLTSIAVSGPKTGVYVLVMRDEDQKPPSGFQIQELKRWSTTIKQEGDRFIWDDTDFGQYHLTLDRMPPLQQTRHLMEKIKNRSDQADLVQVRFTPAFKQTRKWWSLSSAEELSVAIGRSGARELLSFRVGHGTLQSALIGGKTGSGKSNLLHVIIINLCISYSPDELELYLVDFKKGVEFKAYARMQLPHARVIAIQSEREFGLSVLNELDAELQRRGDLFRNKGVQNIREFRSSNTERMPRIVLLIDEFQEFYTEDDQIASTASLYLDRLVKQGRAFGIHAILASQAIAGPYAISRSTVDQIAIRIALQCSDADSRLILGDDNHFARLLLRPGQAYYNDANGLVEANTPFQILYLTDKDREKYLDSLKQLSQERGLLGREPMIVFEGNAPSDMSSSRAFYDLLTSKSGPDPQHALHAWLGEPISIASHTAATFDRQSRSHLLIAGQNEESAAAMCITSLVSVAAQNSPENIEFHMVDLSTSATPWEACIASLPRLLPHRILPYGRNSVHDAIETVFEMTKRREERTAKMNDPAMLMVLFGIQRAGTLKSLDGYSFPEVTERLFYVLRNGPSVGVNVICWVDTPRNLERILGRKIDEFAIRVALQMSSTDSSELLDASDASRLGPYKAILYAEERLHAFERFRPYALPSKKWLKLVGETLAR